MNGEEVCWRCWLFEASIAAAEAGAFLPQWLIDHGVHSLFNILMISLNLYQQFAALDFMTRQVIIMIHGGGGGRWRWWSYYVTRKERKAKKASATCYTGLSDRLLQGKDMAIGHMIGSSDRKRSTDW